MNKREKIVSFGIPLVLIAGTLSVILLKDEIHPSTAKNDTISPENMKQTSINDKTDKDAPSELSKLKRNTWKTAQEEEKEIRDIQSQLKQQLTDDDRLDLISELYGSTNPLILEIVYRELDNPNVDIRLEALDLLSEFNNEDIFDNLSKALNDKSEDVRTLAIELLDNVEISGGNSYEAELLAKGVNDQSEDVRDSALSVLQDKPTFEIETVAEKAITSKHPDVKREILSDLAQAPSMRGVEIMMKGLRDKDQEFKEDVQFELEIITEQEFDTYDEAKEWWNKNKAKLEDELKQDEDIIE